MQQHAPPGKGILSPGLHKKLENFLFERNTLLSVHIFSVTFLYALLGDVGLRAFLLNEDDKFGLNAVVILWIFAALLVYYTWTVATRTTNSRVGKLVAYTIVGLAPLLIGIEYFLEALKDGAIDNVLLMTIALYYLFVGLISFFSNAKEHQTDQGKHRTDFSDTYSHAAFLTATALALGTSSIALTVFHNENYSWAYIATVNSVLWVVISRAFHLDNNGQILTS